MDGMGKKLEPSNNGGRTNPGWTTDPGPETFTDRGRFGMIPRFWPAKKELLKTRPYLADPSTGHPLCSFVRDPNEVLDILDRSWRKPFTLSNYILIYILICWPDTRKAGRCI